MAITEFKAALNQVASERGIKVDDVLESIKSALASAYRKDYGKEEEDYEIDVELDSDTGEAKILKKGKDVTPSGFGRIAAQTAKQVILQKIRETEKQVVMDEFEDKIGTIFNGVLFRIDGSRVILDLGKAQGTLPQSEQVETENYRLGQRLKVLIKEVKNGPRGPEIIVSRADPDFVAKLFEQEVPEIAAGTVVIKAIAREAGSRTKIAVYSNDEKVDPVGSCVGQKGVRVQSIISELFGEKIDIIPFSNQIEKFIAASLSPARVTDVTTDEEENRALVTVPEDQQSLAIGREGQNARLANKLTKWKIDIKGMKGIFDSDTGETIDGKEETKAQVGIWDEAIQKVKAQEDERKAEKAAKELAAAGETEAENLPGTSDNVDAEDNTDAVEDSKSVDNDTVEDAGVEENSTKEDNE